MRCPSVHPRGSFRTESSLNLNREMERRPSSGLELDLDQKKAEDDEARKSSGENSDSSFHVEDMDSSPLSPLPGAPSGIDE